MIEAALDLAQRYYAFRLERARRNSAEERARLGDSLAWAEQRCRELGLEPTKPSMAPNQMAQRAINAATGYIPRNMAVADWVAFSLCVPVEEAERWLTRAAERGLVADSDKRSPPQDKSPLTLHEGQAPCVWCGRSTFRRDEHGRPRHGWCPPQHPMWTQGVNLQSGYAPAVRPPPLWDPAHDETQRRKRQKKQPLHSRSGRRKS